MQALIYRRFGSPDEMEWADGWPKPELSDRSVLIKAVAGGVNPKDVLLRKGKFSKTLARDPLPRVSGLDVAGEITAIGSHVHDFSVGDVIFGMTNKFAGGVHAEVAKLNQTEIFKIPSNISIAEASCVPLAAQTALQALRDCCNIKQGHKVLINGASGGVGHFAVQIAKAMDAEVHAVSGPKNVPFVESLGADYVYSYADCPATEIDHSFDAVLDVFGKFTRSEFVRQLGKRGIFASTLPSPATLLAEILARFGISKTSRIVMVRSRSDDLRQIKVWIENGTVKPHLEKKYAPDQAPEAHRHIESKHTVGKICIRLSS